MEKIIDVNNSEYFDNPPPLPPVKLQNVRKFLSRYHLKKNTFAITNLKTGIFLYFYERLISNEKTEIHNR